MEPNPVPLDPLPAVQPSAEYLVREKRLDDAKNLRKPDRIPVVPLVNYYPNVIRGVSNRDMHYDLALRARLQRDCIVEHGWDAATPFGNLLDARALELVGATQYRWPGGGLPNHVPFQFIEGEYMLQEEYDEMLANPAAFAVKKVWPRVATALAPASALAQAPLPPILYFSNSDSLPILLADVLSDPRLVEMLEKVLAVAKQVATGREQAATYTRELTELGYPLLFDAMTMTAFDCISDLLRGLRGSLLDMYQLPEKLLAAIDMFTPWTIEQGIRGARMSGNKAVFIPLHRGAAGFMSNEQFGRFYWPSLKALLIGLFEAELTPIPFFEGDYTPRLEFLQQLPPKMVVAHFDRIDRRRAKQMLGNVMCFWGNVPSSLLCAGTVEEVKNDVRELVEIFGDSGGLIIDGSVGVPDESKKANVLALSEVVCDL